MKHNAPCNGVLNTQLMPACMHAFDGITSMGPGMSVTSTWSLPS